MYRFYNHVYLKSLVCILFDCSVNIRQRQKNVPCFLGDVLGTVGIEKHQKQSNFIKRLNEEKPLKPNKIEYYQTI